MPEENQDTTTLSLKAVVDSLKSIDRRLNEQDMRLQQLEAGMRKPELASVPMLSEDEPPPPPPPEVVTVQKAVSPIPPLSSTTKGSMEENIGIKWMTRIGITALILGVSFLLSLVYSDVGPVGKFMMSIGIGIVLLALGEKTIRKYNLYGQMLSGGGIAIFYLSFYSAYSVFNPRLIEQPVAFVAMIVVTIIGVLLSLRYQALPLMLTTVVGGFATPIMASSGENNMVGLFSYIIMLDLGVLAISIFRRWHSLNAVSFVGTIILFVGWAQKFYTVDQRFGTLFFLTAFFLIYSISALVYNLIKKESSTGVEQILTLLAGSVYFAACYSILNDDYHAFMGFFALLLGVYYLLWAMLTKELTPKDKNLYSFLAFLTIGFITLAIPIQFEKSTITIVWAIEAALVLILGLRMARAEIKVFGLVVYILALIRVFFIDISVYADNEPVIANRYFITATFVILASYLIAWQTAKAKADEPGAEQGIRKVTLLALVIIVANLLTVVAGSHEIIRYYDNKVAALEQSQASERQDSFAYDQRPSYQLQDTYAANREEIKSFRNRSGVILSLFWLLYGVMLIAIGFARNWKRARLGGLLLLFLAILKLFLYDLMMLSSIYRVFSFIFLGAMLLAVSFGYQKYKDKIKETFYE